MKPKQFETEAMPHLALIHRAATRVLGDVSRADDITQEVFLNAWRCFDRYEPGTNCKAWLFRILFHTIQHYHRREGRYSQAWVETETFFSRLPAAPIHVEELTDEELIGLVNRLPEHYRAVLLLVDLEEFSYRETAEVLGIPMGTVMSRLSRARAQMRELIQSGQPRLDWAFLAAKRSAAATGGSARDHA